MFSIKQNNKIVKIKHCIRTSSSYTKIINRDTSTWYVRGKLGRFGQPACIDLRRIALFSDVYDERIEMWRCNGKIHRFGGPAYVKMREGKSVEETWFNNDLLHRPPHIGPAHTVYLNMGLLKTWYNYGKFMFVY
jgi:hypothetical protein